LWTEISFEENQLKDTLDVSFEELETRFEMCGTQDNPCNTGGGGGSTGGTSGGGCC
jgi:hypothetical protein